MSSVMRLQGEPSRAPAFAQLAQAPLPSERADNELRSNLRIDDITFNRLHGEHEIAQIRYLREAIAIPACVREKADFQELEKKETSTVLSAFSGPAPLQLAPSGSFR